MNSKKNVLIFLSVLIVLIVGGYFLTQKKSPQVNLTLTISPSSNSSITPTLVPSSKPSAKSLPSSFLINNFSFQTQAPLANWDQLHEEACEEASLILVKYWQDHHPLSSQGMENEIQKLVSWENQNGYPQDVTIAELGEISQKYYQMKKPTVENNITIGDLKKAISKNHPVIVPAAGRLLGNPYFTAPGPAYHMVVAIGYEGNNIIVQDVGTKRGNHYKYNQDVFYNAIHDWNGSKDNINSGKKAILVFN